MPLTLVPYRRRYTRFSRFRRPFRRSRRPFRRFTRRRPVGMPFVPRSIYSSQKEFIIRKLRFATSSAQDITSTSGALSGDIVYRANDLYDPLEAAGGGQPRCFDEIMSLYRYFVVLGSKITMHVGYGAGSATSMDITLLCNLKDGTTAFTTAQEALEHPRVKFCTISASNSSKTLVHKYSWKIHGCRDPIDCEDLWGTSSASPTRQWYWHVNAYTNDGTSTEAVYYTYVIEYTAAFFHSIEPSAS